MLGDGSDHHQKVFDGVASVEVGRIGVMFLRVLVNDNLATDHTHAVIPAASLCVLKGWHV
jgi:hypothetical protein